MLPRAAQQHDGRRAQAAAQCPLPSALCPALCPMPKLTRRRCQLLFTPAGAQPGTLAGARKLHLWLLFKSTARRPITPANRLAAPLRAVNASLGRRQPHQRARRRSCLPRRPSRPSRPSLVSPLARHGPFSSPPRPPQIPDAPRSVPGSRRRLVLKRPPSPTTANGLLATPPPLQPARPRRVTDCPDPPSAVTTSDCSTQPARSRGRPRAHLSAPLPCSEFERSQAQSPSPAQHTSCPALLPLPYLLPTDAL